MIRSMTGYGQGKLISDDRKFTVEIRSVNHRYNDINVRLPRTLNYLEDKIRTFIKERVSRGKIDVFVSFETTSKDDFEVYLNENLLDAYLEQLNIIKNKSTVIDDISVSLLARFPEVIIVNKKEDDKDILWQLLEEALKEAFNDFLAMREKEGENLKEDLLAKLKVCENYLAKIKERSPNLAEEYKNKLEKRLQELLPDHSIDENRLAMEIAIFADHCSIDEEIVRLESHINQFRNILNHEEIVGRKLDFLVQEMNREVNTIGSKANDLQISQSVIELKSEIEKIREQIQNLE
ncbi:MAG: YicC family protein [Epulopiscium sp.]|nr:YicC family protein [Candidatus Epulonipiscium sp.]HOQ15902.1 YicC family protein [Defluviitaleaceae bacterium]HPT75791.1 YicC family protein [Defluviitaleaceae bacterium]